MSSANLSFGNAPADPNDYLPPTEITYKLDSEGHLVYAHNGEKVILAEEQKRVAEKALEESANNYRTRLGTKLAQEIMAEEYPEIATDPMNSRISVSKNDLYDLIIKSAVRAQKVVGR